MITGWLAGLLRRRGGRSAAAAVGIAVAVALLASLGAFLASSRATMTDRAVRTVAVDWQVQVQPGSDPGAVLSLARRSPGVRSALPVEIGRTTGLSAQTGTTAQTTGPGVVLGLPAHYRDTFPGELRTLAGSGSGVLLAQQTAANLHAAPGTTITIGRTGARAARVRVAGVVDLPQADSLFQKVGAPVGSQPAAPPDNVVLLPQHTWHTVFDPPAASASSTQVHIVRNHRLPADPAAAYTAVTAAAHNLEARSAGGAVVGDNLASTLDAARSDAAYAQILFLFLGLPGAVLAGLLTAALTASGAGRRRREQALLRTRGASRGQLLGLAAVEAAVVGVAGCLLGLGVASIVGAAAFGSVRFGNTAGSAAAWVGGAATVGLLIAAATVLLPAYRDLRDETVAAGRVSGGRPRAPRWLRWGLDGLLLAGGGLAFYLTSRNGYQLVLAPEGTPTISVSYWAFAAPALLWAGVGLAVWRLTYVLLGAGRGLVRRALRPVTAGVSGPVAASISRQRRVLAGATVLLALSLAFAGSTAIFNATYRQQAEADATLTNGADVTVTESPGVTVGPHAATALAATPGVRSVEPLQHRFAYVGADLQDLYGVRPDTIARVAALQDGYFQGGTATQLLARLAARPDSVLVSAETVKDFQLGPGDRLTLRLQNGRTKQFTRVAFRYAGIVKEFPTAPKDSFFVANSSYVAAKTGSNAVGAFLVDTGGKGTTAAANRIRASLGPSATVSDIANARGAVGSSLTSVDLAGLTRIELGFALAIAAASGGLVLALGLAERRRTFAIAGALGATARQLRGFVVGEALVLAVGGLVAGAAASWVLAETIVAVLTGVFDPPPSALALPWLYLLAAFAIAIASLAGVAAAATRLARRSAVSVLREL